MMNVHLDLTQLPKGWYLINVFHHVSAGQWYCRVRRGQDPKDQEITAAGLTAEIAFEGACNGALVA